MCEQCARSARGQHRRQPSRIATSHEGSAQSRNSTNRRVKLRWEIIIEVRASWHRGSRINLRQIKGGSPRRMHQTQQHVPLQWEKQTWPCGRRLAGTRGRQKPDSVCWFEWTRASKLLWGQWRPPEDCEKLLIVSTSKKYRPGFRGLTVWRPTFPAQISVISTPYIGKTHWLLLCLKMFQKIYKFC